MATELTKLTETSELKALQELHLVEWPKHCVAYFWLDNYLRWMGKEPCMNHLAFYTLNGDWPRDGLFILLHRYQLFFSNLSRQKTPELLAALNLWDWSRGYKVSALHEAHHEIYKEVGVKRHLFLDREMKTIMYRMPCEKAKQLEVNCPVGYFLDNVRLEHAELINGLWSARHSGSLKLIQLLIEHNTNVGLYEQETGELCAWCLRLQSGFLGALEVLSTHQRRGLGLVVAAAITRRVANELGHDATALVNLNNVAARKVFHKLGFALHVGEHYHWSMCLPRAGDDISWPANE